MVGAAAGEGRLLGGGGSVTPEEGVWASTCPLFPTSLSFHQLLSQLTLSTFSRRALHKDWGGCVSLYLGEGGVRH